MIILKERSQRELEKIKGSRFIAVADRIASEEEAKIFLAEIRSMYPAASHYCYAWRLSPEQERANDDGEPKGSAGLPILKRLSAKDCVNTMVIVVRYFGGSKLGVGGLVRAYGGAAAAVLEHSDFEAYQEWSTLSFFHRYSDTGHVEQALSRFTHRVERKTYSDQVFLQISVHKEHEQALLLLLSEKMAGRIVPTNIAPKP